MSKVCRPLDRSAVCESVLALLLLPLEQTGTVHLCLRLSVRSFRPGATARKPKSETIHERLRRSKAAALERPEHRDGIVNRARNRRRYRPRFPLGARRPNPGYFLRSARLHRICF